MARTTLDIDSSVLEELRRRKAAEGGSLGALVSELLARALDEPARDTAPVHLRSKEMRALVDLRDKGTLQEILDEDR